MGNISRRQYAKPWLGPESNTCLELLNRCLGGEPWTEGLLDRALAVDKGRAFLEIVIERLGDLFEPRLCEVYAQLFSQVIRRLSPELAPRLRRGLPARKIAPKKADRVYVLSRVTLGADVAVTSVLLDAAKRKYPEAEIVFVGPKKSFELFAKDPRIRHLKAPYSRGGSLKKRLEASGDLWLEDGLVIDPDSRLSQLGVLKVCPSSNYLFFPSRSYGGRSLSRLPDLAARWAKEIMGVERAAPFVAPDLSKEAPADVTVSLGVGGNKLKRLYGGFEEELLHLLAKTGASIVVDKGGDDEERERVEEAAAGLRTHDGAFASFASLIAQSKLYVGYDSAGGHVASACGVPVISIAAGFVNERMAARWRPIGAVVDGKDPRVLRRIKEILTARWPGAARV